MIDHIWVCECGIETPCTPKDTEAGAVFQCPCGVVWGCVRKKLSPKVWVEISIKDVVFHKLLEEGDDE